MARRATATPTTTVLVTKTATAAGTDTPVAATAVQGTMVAANASPSGIAQSAAALAATATAVPLGDQFPAPTLKNALPDSPLAHTVPYTPAVRLIVSQVSDPGLLTVCKPVPEPDGLDMLKDFDLSVVRIKSQSRTHLQAIVAEASVAAGNVAAGNVSFIADYRPRDSGYALTLKRLSAVPGGLPPQAGFNAESAARIFLGAHQLTKIGSTALKADSVVTQADGSTLVTFSEQYAPGKIVGASAAVTFQAGVLSTLAIQWVDTSVCPSAPGVPFLEALDSVLAGDGLIHTAGPLPDASARVVGTDIVYVPVSGVGGTYYEPVWRISGVTGTAGAAPFEIYVPAISDAYLR